MYQGFYNLASGMLTQSRNLQAFFTLFLSSTPR